MKQERKDTFSLFFATDLHGSTHCFKKFLKAKEFYNVDFLMLGGDWTGKELKIIYQKSDNEYFLPFQSFAVDKQELAHHLQHYERVGVYYHISSKKADEHSMEERVNLFKTYSKKRLKHWINLTENAELNIKIPYIMGNDDFFGMEDLIEESNVFVNADSKSVIIEDAFNVLGYSYSTPTPWDTPREKKDNFILPDLEEIIMASNDLPTIFNIHVPPKGIGLDEVVKINSKFEPEIGSSGVSYTYAGSQSVFDYVKMKQPELALFGHVHEGKGVSRIKKTTCINPGSIYYEGKLQGLICTFKNKKLTSWQLTEG